MNLVIAGGLSLVCETTCYPKNALLAARKAMTFLVAIDPKPVRPSMKLWE